MGVYNIKEVALMVDIPETTIRTYLGHFSFAKYYKNKKIEVSNDFYNTLIKYLWNKRAKYKYIRNVERLINE
jgi:alanyl-tRNA synthetase